MYVWREPVSSNELCDTNELTEDDSVILEILKEANKFGIAEGVEDGIWGQTIYKYQCNGNTHQVILKSIYICGLFLLSHIDIKLYALHTDKNRCYQLELAGNQNMVTLTRFAQKINGKHLN